MPWRDPIQRQLGRLWLLTELRASISMRRGESRLCQPVRHGGHLGRGRPCRSCTRLSLSVTALTVTSWPVTRAAANLDCRSVGATYTLLSPSHRGRFLLPSLLPRFRIQDSDLYSKSRGLMVPTPHTNSLEHVIIRLLLDNSSGQVVKRSVTLAMQHADNTRTLWVTVTNGLPSMSGANPTYGYD